MRKDVILPARSFAWAGDRPAGGGQVPTQDLVLTLILKLNPIGPDRFRHALENAYWAPSIVVGNGSKAVAEKGSSQMLLNEQTPRLTGWAGGAFPGIGRTLPSRHFLILVPSIIGILRFWRRTLALPAKPSVPSSSRNPGSMCSSGQA